MKKVKVVGHQGDLVIMEVDVLPETDLFQDEQCKDGILAFGEGSGHAHQLEYAETAEVYKSKNPAYDGLMFLKPKTNLKLVHGRARGFEGVEEDNDYHNTIVLDPSKKYITGIVEETDWVSRTIRRVID